MSEYYFISHSSVDGKEFCAQLADALRTGDPAIEPWVDNQRLRPGDAWDDQISEAIRECKGLLFVMTKDSVHSGSVCKLEWSRALKYKKPVIPLLVEKNVDIPFRLESREYVDFTYSFEEAITRLREHLTWIDTPEGVLHSLKIQLRDLERQLPRSDPQRQNAIRDDIHILQQRIAEQKLLVEHPDEVNQSTKERINEGLEKERQAESELQPVSSGKFVHTAPAVPPTWFQDRHVETGLIADFIGDEALRLLIVTGRAGIGKTAMVCRLLKSLESDRLPDDGGPLSVDGIIYLSATGSRRVNFAGLFADLCLFLPETTFRRLQAVYQNPQMTNREKMQALLENFPTQRIIVLLDNFEDIVDTQTREIRDAELDEALQALLQAPQHGVKVIITTRIAPRSLQLVEAGKQTVLELDKGLETPFAENILRAMDRDGKIGLRHAPAELLKTARERTRGYPRALEALFAILSADRDSSLQEILNEAQGLLPENVVQVLVGEAFSRLDTLAQKVMQALAIYGFSVPDTAIDYLLQPHEPGINSKPVLKRLVNMQFVRRDGGLYYLHPVDRAYALDRITKGKPEDWKSGEQTLFTLYNLRHRGAAYFRQIRREESTWTSLEDLKPLFAEFELLADSGDFENALEVLLDMVEYLERGGYYRQVERLAQSLAQKAEGPIRGSALGWAGWALSNLGEEKEAVNFLKEALQTANLDPIRANNIRIDLARSSANLRDYETAAEAYETIIETSPDDPGMQIEAMLGKGWLAERQNLYREAEAAYLDALKTYIDFYSMEMVEDGSFQFKSKLLPAEAPFSDPSAWYLLSEIEFKTDTGSPVTEFLFGVQNEPFSDAIPELDQDSTTEEDLEIKVTPVLASEDLPRIWENLSGFYERTDYYVNAYACCRLAFYLYDLLGIDSGIVFTLESLRRMAIQFSDDEAQEIIAVQEQALEQARASHQRRLEITIMENLAQTYLERNRIDEAEQFYQELLQHARELENIHLSQQVEFSLARLEWVRDRPEAAVERLKRLQDRDDLELPLHTDIQFLLARIENARRDRARAATYAFEANQGYMILKSSFQFLETEQFLATLAIEERDYDGAVQRLEAAREQAFNLGIPSLIASVLSDLGNAYYWAGMKEKALEIANEAYHVASEIKLSALAGDTLSTVGRIAAELRKFDLSKRSYDQALHAYESIGNLYGQININSGLAWMYSLQEIPMEQIAAARQAWVLAKEYNDPILMRDIHMDLGLALSDNGFHEEAIQHLEDLRREAPYDSIIMVNSGWVLYQAGEYDRSIAESHLALETNENETMAIRNLGHAYLANGLPDEAEREYRRAIEVRKGGEHFIETIRVVKKLLEEKPNTPRGQEMLALLEAEQQKLDASKAAP